MEKTLNTTSVSYSSLEGIQALSQEMNLDKTSEEKKYFFHYDKVMFGELFGKSTAPVQVSNNRIFFNFHCLIHRGKVEMMEKYTFSLSSEDIEELHIHFGCVPSFVAIETSRKFARVVCQRIGSDVLCPESNDAKKRYILLTGNTSLKDNFANDVEQCNLITSISKWARVNLLSYNDALEMITQIGKCFPNKKKCKQKNFSKKIMSLTPQSSVLNSLTSNLATFTFTCSKVKFGKLFGKSMAPVRVAGGRMYFIFNCAVKRHRKKSVEKYTFSVGSNDVSNMYIYIGHMPSFLVVQTTGIFAHVVCNRIGKKVLFPGSTDAKKRYIFLLLNSFYNETYQRSKHTKDCFVQHVSPWTTLNILSSTEAIQMLQGLL